MKFIGSLMLWQEQELIVVAGYLACLAMTESNFQQKLNGLAGYLAWIAKKISKPYFSRLDEQILQVLIKWPVCLDKFHQASDGMASDGM